MSTSGSLKHQNMKSIYALIEKVGAGLKTAALGGDIEGWVCEKVFIERSGLSHRQARYDFRKEHPDLVRVNEKKQYIYHLPGYFETFKKVG